MRGMQLVRPGSLAKSNVLSSVVRNTSCSRGWLRLLVQSIFAAVTVASFILILLMAIPLWPKTRPVDESSRCRFHHCRIVCQKTPYFGTHEEDIIHVASEAEENCLSIFLILHSPMFVNNKMPPKWLSGLRTNIHELTILSGNLNHIPADAFMSQYTSTIRVLVFRNLFLKTWTADSLVGLSNLQRFYIKDCTIGDVPRDALRPIDDTLQSLTVIRSGHWDPTNVTGSSTFLRLTSVDFSLNSFKNILGATSFTGLQRCKILYLNSCEIISIGAGAFDNLHDLQVLYLQNNFLVTVPDGLFENIISITNPKPRINLQDNLWHCDCSSQDIRKLIQKNMLLTEPICNSPEYYQYKTLSDFEAHCSESEYKHHNILDATERSTRWHDKLDDDIDGFVYVSNDCFYGKEVTPNSSLKILSPVYGHKCHPRVPLKNYNHLVTIFSSIKFDPVMNKNRWITFTYFLRTMNYSLVQIETLDSDDYGLVWYQSTCPNEVYCVNDVPSVFRIYNIDLSAQYIFCPIALSSGAVDSENCVHYQNVSFGIEDAFNTFQILLYIGTGTVCLVFGALCVYALILKHPYLLKGSKRILFVKHKTVDALVLPPKVPLRNDLINDLTPNCDDRKIFIVPSNHHVPNRFIRSTSARSSKSSTPSYISALQPTEDQLAEWRIRHHFNVDMSLASTPSDLSTLSWISNNDGLHHSVDFDNYRVYESLK